MDASKAYRFGPCAPRAHRTGLQTARILTDPMHGQQLELPHQMRALRIVRSVPLNVCMLVGGYPLPRPPNVRGGILGHY